MTLAVQVLRAASSLESAARRAFKDIGLSPAQFNVLNIVSDHPDGISFTEVADQLLVDRSNITLLVRRLVSDGLLEVTPSPVDGRQKVLRLTAVGTRKWKQADRLYREGLERVTKELGVAATKAVNESLRRVEAVANELFR